MKTIKLLIAAVGIISLVSCEDMLDLGVEIESDEITVDFVIAPTDFVGEKTFASEVIESDFDAALADAGVSRDDVTSVKIKEVNIEITNDDASLNFDAFEKVEASLAVEGMSEIVIASIDSIPQGARSLACDINSTELLDYVMSNEYTVHAKGKTVKAIEKQLNIRGSLTFSIKTSMGLEMN